MKKPKSVKHRSAELAKARYSILEQEIEDHALPGDSFALWQSDPFRQWLLSLNDPATRARIDYALTKMATGVFGDWKPVADGVREMRLDFGPGYRIYFRRVGREILLLLGGGDKKSQREDIKAAETLWRRIKSGMDEV